MSEIPIRETARLRLRRFESGDAAFIVELLNQPSFIRYIGDRGVHSEDDARRYLEAGPLASYAGPGYGLYGVELKASGAPIGMCGLLKRETLDAPDLGFAFLPAYEGHGYAHEAALAALEDARAQHGVARVLAITKPDNARSMRLLLRLGFVRQGVVELPAHGGPSALFARG